MAKNHSNMKIYKYITTVKAKDPKGKMPTHYLKATENQTDKEGELVASLWAKTWEDPKTKEVKKWLSGEMKSQWTDHTDPSKSREGFVIIKERDLNEMLKVLGEEDTTPESEDIPPDDIPF